MMIKITSLFRPRQSFRVFTAFLLSSLLCFSSPPCFSQGQGGASSTALSSFVAPGVSLPFDLQALDQLVEKAMKDWSVPGVAIAIVYEGKIAYIKTYGVKNVTTNEPLTLHTRMPLASLTKNLTAMLVGRLVDQGILNWEDKVQKYLPKFQLHDAQTSAQMTIEDLLSHTSGLPGFSCDTLVELNWTEEEVMEALLKIPSENGLGEAYGYQNVFPGIAGHLLQSHLKKPLPAIFEETLFAPLAMTKSYLGRSGGKEKSSSFSESPWEFLKKKFFSFFPAAEDITREYSHIEDPKSSLNKAQEIKGGNSALDCFLASRGGWSSITDMAKWLLFQVNEGRDEKGQSLISSLQIQRMRSPHILIGPPKGGQLFPADRVKNVTYGLGWFIHDYDRLNVVGHMGGMNGTRTLIAIAPEEKLGIVILSNVGGMRVSLLPEAIRSGFFDLYLKHPDSRDWSQELLKKFQGYQAKAKFYKEKSRQEDPRPPRELKSYEGTFENDLYGSIRIHCQDQKYLQLTYSHHGKTLSVPLTHWNGDMFEYPSHMLSKAQSGLEKGMVIFRMSPEGGVQDVQIDFFHEGQNPLFIPHNSPPSSS